MKKQSYEEALKRLSDIVDKLEAGSETLEKSMALFEEGTKLSNYCYQCLENAQQKVLELSEVEENRDE